MYLRIIRLAVVIGTCLMGCMPGLAQERVGNMILYNSLRGLSQGALSGICESRNGYLWIGSENGLFRFDGYRYKRMVAGPGSITDNLVTDVAEAADGSIWVGGFTKGVSRFDPVTHTFRQYPNLWRGAATVQRVRKILPLPNGEVWLATDGMGLARYMPSTDSFTFYSPGRGVAYPGKQAAFISIMDIARDPVRPDLLWLCTQEDIYRFDCATKQFDLHSTRLPNGGIPGWQCLERVGNDGLFLGSWGSGMYHYNTSTRILKNLPHRRPDGKPVNGIVVPDVMLINDSTVWWACADYGLLQYHLPSGKLSFAGPAVRTDSTQKHHYVFNRISKTSSGSIFISMRGNYGQVLPAYTRLGRLITPVWEKRNYGIIATSVVYQPGQQHYLLACAGPASLLAIDPSLHSWRSLPVVHHTLTRGLSQLVLISDDTLLALGFDGQLYRMPAGAHTMEVIPKPPWVRGRISHLRRDSRGYLWLLNQQKLYRCRTLDSNPTDSFSLRSRVTDSLGIRPIFYSLITDNHGRAWISSSEGLWMAEPGRKLTHHIHPYNMPGEPLADNLIKCMAIDKKDRVWMGYNGSGLQILDANTQKIVTTLSGSSFASTVINALNELPDGRMLATTPEGLLAVSPQSLQWQQYDRLDGLYQSDLDGGMLVSRDGLVIINHYAKLNVFRAGELNIPAQKLLLNITEVTINDKPFPATHFSGDSAEIDLPVNQNNIRISFAAMHTAYPMRTRYTYRIRMGNKQADWLPLSEPTLQLTALKPGIYQIELQATGAGDSVSSIKEIAIRIQPPVWQRWWFLLITAVLLAAAIYSLYRFRINQLKRTITLRNNISANLHDDIGASLSNIQILNEMARRNLANPEASRQYLERSGEDIQRVSEALSDIVWNVNPRYDDLDQLFIRMKRYAADLLDSKDIVYQLDFPQSAAGMHMNMDQRRDFYLIFKESLNNVLKHSAATQVHLVVTLTAQQIILQLTDNGKGFDTLNPKQGNGLQNMGQRADKWKGSLLIESMEQLGTHLTLTFPVA